MIESLELSTTPFRHICHRTEDESMQSPNPGSNIGNILTLLKFDFTTVLRDVLVWFLLGPTGGISEYLPEICDSEDHGGTMES